MSLLTNAALIIFLLLVGLTFYLNFRKNNRKKAPIDWKKKD